MQTATAEQVIIPGVTVTDNNIRWFSDNGCVEFHPDVVEVSIGGTLIAAYDPRDKDLRDIVLVNLSEDSGIRKGKLAEAFGIGAERLRLIRKQIAERGLTAIYERSHERRGRKSVVPPALRRRLYGLFESGMTAKQTFAEVGDTAAVSYRTICRVYRSWKQDQVASALPVQIELGEAEDVDEVERSEPVDADASMGDERLPPEGKPEPKPKGESDAVVPAPDETVPMDSPRSGRQVQHLGGWLLLSVVHALGLHAAILCTGKIGQVVQQRLRVVIDAVVLALGLGQRCVEGVRRLQTPTAGVLLRAHNAPSESWTRRVLKQCVEKMSAFWLQMSMMQRYLQRARQQDQTAAVFYIDNHMRPYTGKRTIRKGWRMQDKRVRPGTSDYYVHDEDGRPLFRYDVPSNDSLTAWLQPVILMLRAALGKQKRLLVAFDRAGAFPEQMKKLRDGNIEFVTYERRPYPLLSSSAFDEQVVVRSDSNKEPEVIGIHESRNKNLGKGRGRVRRIALKMPDGHQVNLVAVSQEPKERLIEVMLGRWVQENAFKHGNERWGINQLDRRKVNPYAPDTVIPNPARRRLDHALRLARQREGDARRRLARLAATDPKRAKVENDLAESLTMQQQLESQRPHVPNKAPLHETELAGKLVYHPGEYKTLLDTIRIASANAESELAAALAPHLRRPREAKKALANLFAAPGNVRVNARSITVTLTPAGTPDELHAFEELFRAVNRWPLVLPGDPDRRHLRFRSQLS